MKPAWIVLGIIVVLVLFVISIYNRLVALRQNRTQAFSDIEVQLKQRYDLVPQLVETVKGYAAHEKGILENVTAARSAVGAAKNTSQRIEAENMLTRAMSGLYAVSENYPDLKANTNFQSLMNELSDIENKLAAARRYFNNATAELNTAVQSFPAVLFAAMLGFRQEEFFEVPQDERDAIQKAPQVKFGS